MAEMEKEINETPAEETAETVEQTVEVNPWEEKYNAERDAHLRVAAEYDNYRKRTQAEKLRVYADATAKAVEELLPLTDSVTAALESTPEDDAQRKGIELIGNQLAKCLEKLGVTPFGEVGEPFDPMYHNAVARTDNPDLPANSIAMVFQKGFKIGDKVVRFAMVQVAN